MKIVVYRMTTSEMMMWMQEKLVQGELQLKINYKNL